MQVTPNFKQPRIRSRAHMAWLATMPCTICDRKPVQVHHLTSSPEPKARGLKAGDLWCVPLCVRHHSDLHNMGDERAFWELHKIDPIRRCEFWWNFSPAPEAQPNDHGNENA